MELGLPCLWCEKLTKNTSKVSLMGTGELKLVALCDNCQKAEDELRGILAEKEKEIIAKAVKNHANQRKVLKN